MIALALLTLSFLSADGPAASTSGAVPAPLVGPVAPPDDAATAAAIARGVEFLLSAQEGPGGAEWPYEGVYRVKASFQSATGSAARASSARDRKSTRLNSSHTATSRMPSSA